jgi:murein L,D-transpeptidase YcbB/YkuD
LKQLRTERRGSLPKPPVLIALVCSAFNLASSAQTQLVTSGIAGTSMPELSSQSQVLLRAVINAGSFADLGWPDFSDYSKHVEKFYELNGGSLWWVKGMEPTTQAREMIALMLPADQKGLSADDYDGPRWNDRLAKLKPATRQPTEAEAVKFDLALTVCAMRYVSDLHIGKVNPKHRAFALDDESKRYDLAEFLRDHVVGASDVAGILAQVEPSYPGYRRTIQAHFFEIVFRCHPREETRRRVQSPAHRSAD